MSETIDYTLAAKWLKDSVPFVNFLDLEFGRIDSGYAEVTIPERDNLKNHVDGQHAGVLFSAAETASGAAFMAAFIDQMATITPLVERSEISYKKIARGTMKAVAELVGTRDEILARLDEDGRARFEVQVKLLDSDNEETTNVTFHWYIRRK